VKVVWLPSAISDLGRLEDFLTRDAEPNSGDVAGLIKDATRSLQDFPQRCRRVPGRLNFRELFVEARSQTYVVQFRITGQDVVIVRIWHGKESR
jgi:toxin ParE1/3/4